MGKREMVSLPLPCQTTNIITTARFVYELKRGQEGVDDGGRKDQ